MRKSLMVFCVLAISFVFICPSLNSTNYNGHWWFFRNVGDKIDADNYSKYKIKLDMINKTEFVAKFEEEGIKGKLKGQIIEGAQTIISFTMSDTEADYYAYFIGWERDRNNWFEGRWFSTNKEHGRGFFHIKRGASDK